MRKKQVIDYVVKYVYLVHIEIYNNLFASSEKVGR